MVSSVVVGLRDIGDEQTPATPPLRVAMSIRLPPGIKAYLEETGTKRRGGQTEVIVAAIELDRDLAQQLASDVQRIKTFADSEGLSMRDDLPVVLARLVRQGLDAIEHREPKKNGTKK